MKSAELNVKYWSKDPRAKLLSALVNRPFLLDGRWFASLEGFYQGIKFPYWDPRREEAFASSFGHAKKFSLLAGEEWTWWGGEEFPYAGERHREVIELGFRASFVPGSDREKALLDTEGLVLVHNTGEEDRPNSPLPQSEFGPLLMRIREERKR